MQEKLTSEGVCVFCENTFKQAGMNRHLNTHLKKMEKENSNKKSSYLVNVKADIMFLSLWVDGKTDFGELDDFLRAIWLECCGHMSSFRDYNGNYSHPKEDNDDVFGFGFDFGSNAQEVPMDFEVSKVFRKGKKLNYEYDYGNSTYLKIEVKQAYDMPASDSIVLLSRNEPLKIMCVTCDANPATAICSIHLWEGKGYFCEKCAKKHEKKCGDFEDYARLEVVNSPRMGVCAYEGGAIDTERDGVYTEKV